MDRSTDRSVKLGYGMQGTRTETGIEAGPAAEGTTSVLACGAEVADAPGAVAASLHGRGVHLNEATLLRQIGPERIRPQVLMARTMSKEEEKLHFFLMERYRLLASRVFEVARNRKTQVFLTASALAEEGKTLTAANLAYAMSNARNKRTLLIELDLRRPSMRSLFNLQPDADEEFFLETKDWHDSLWSLGPNLHALLVPRPAMNPDSLLHGDRTRQLIDQARKEYDYVLIDSAPLLLAVDTHVLLPLIDHALLVVRADKTLISCCQEAQRVLGDKGMGCVLNDVKRLKYESYYRAYYG